MSQLNPPHTPVFKKSILLSVSRPYKRPLPFKFSDKNVVIFFFIVVRATCLTHPILLNLLTLIPWPPRSVRVETGEKHTDVGHRRGGRGGPGGGGSERDVSRPVDPLSRSCYRDLPSAQSLLGSRVENSWVTPVAPASIFVSTTRICFWFAMSVMRCQDWTPTIVLLFVFRMA